MALGFEPYDIGFIIWIGLLPLLSVLWTGPARFWRGFFMTWLYGMGWYGVSFWWIHEVGYVFNIPTWLFLIIAFLPLMAVYSAMLGLWGGMMARLLRPRLEAPPTYEPNKRQTKKDVWNSWAWRDTLSTVSTATAAGALFVCVEWMRSSGTLAFSWNTLGMGMYHGLSLVQWAEFVGTTALSFIPVFISVILWGAGRRCYLYFRGMGSPCRTWDFYGGMVLLFILFLGGMFIAKSYSPAALMQRESTIPVPVLAVQINKDQNEKIKERQLGLYNGLYALMEQTVSAHESVIQQQMNTALENQQNLAFPIHQPAWIIWPESALPIDLTLDISQNTIFTDERPVKLTTAREAAMYNYLRNQHLLLDEFLTEMLPQLRSALGNNVVLITGADTHRFETNADGERQIRGMLNSMACFSGTATQDIQSAAKQHLMPFGEYIPLADSCEWIQKTYAEVTGTQVGEGIHPGSGHEPLVLPLPGKQEKIGVIPAVCYEDTVGTKLTKFVRKGPQVIVNISNDAWFRHSACGAQQARNAAFRCIELRRCMVRSANMGACCAIAPNGGIIDSQTNPHAAGYSFAVLPVDQQAGFTLFALAGDWAVAVCALVVLVLCLIRIIRKKLNT